MFPEDDYGQRELKCQRKMSLPTFWGNGDQEGDDVGSVQVLASQGRSFAGLCVGQGDLRRDGYFSKPSLQAHQRGVVTEGAEVTLQCQRPDTEIVAVMFALLKAGTPMPVQRRSPAGKETDFSLQNVSIGDTGNYSCVYYQTRAPFLASRPSDHLAIRVTGSPRTTASDYTTGNLIRLGLAAAALVIAGAFLLEACCSQESPRGVRSPEGRWVLEQARPAVS
ncbi:T-cell-interacting; activating receptor on myeloid cells protein 1 [Camelus dromedarius]|uniref:T-cell-interacting n=1 Tax=Camelus dromedarius TaxID=9838 RepID=A0A5N4DQ83_CAMDR|nr:T-cell-interacting; activating receptor on myeloid cells protein 1 [Camelus dromedarius]